MTAERRNPEHIREIIHEVVSAAVPPAVEQTLLRLGMDASDPIALQEQQEWLRRAVAREADPDTKRDRSWTRRARIRSEKIADAATGTIVKLIVSAAAVIGVFGLVAWIKDQLGQ